MIFVTVGTQLAFDRMISAIDEWAGSGCHDEVFAQIGDSLLTPRNIDWVPSLDQPTFKVRIRESSLIVSHAGMGTILMALELGKPLIVMPRRAELGEHRNDHQLATARELHQRGLITVADDAEDLIRQMDEIDHQAATRPLAVGNDTPLHRFVRSFVGETVDEV